MEEVVMGSIFVIYVYLDKWQECIEHLRLRKFFNKAYDNWMLEMQSEKSF